MKIPDYLTFFHNENKFRKQQLAFRHLYIIPALLLFSLLSSIQPKAQTCTSYQFSKRYTYPGNSYGSFLDTLPNGNLIWGGTKNTKLLLMNVDNDGNFLWSKTYSTTATFYLQNRGRIARDVNNDYFAALDQTCISNINALGSPGTGKKLTIPQDVIGIEDIGVLSNNNRIILARDYSTYAGNGYLLFCMSADLSTILWQKHLSDNNLYLLNLKMIGNQFYIMGRNNDNGLIFGFNQSGTLLSKKAYKIDNKRSFISGLYPCSNGFVVTADYYDGPPNNHVILRLDNNLNVINSYGIPQVYDNAVLKLAVETGGDFYGCWEAPGNFTQHRFFISKTDQVIWSRQSLGTGLNVPVQFLNTDKGLLSFGNTDFNDVVTQTTNGTMLVARSDGNGMYKNCSNSDEPLSTAVLACITAIPAISPRDTSMIISNPVIVTATDNPSVFVDYCSAASTCNNITIIGNTSSCSSGSAIYTAKRNPGCYTPVKWILSGGNAVQQQLSDSSISIQFLQNGVYSLVAQLGQSCATITDSIHINVSISGQVPVLDLGPTDTVICSNNTILLNAHSGFISYLWQDGSTDSTYLVTQPGMYRVITTDACGGTQKDSINVTPYPSPNFGAGPDRVKCNGDTVHINTTSGFINYVWTPPYNINSTNSQNVIVNPLVDTNYYVKAEKFPGCFVFDTVRISVRNSPTLNLGPDKSFCMGGNYIANAGAGFSQYLWNTGAITQQISIYDTGLYSVEGTFSNGCKSVDTLKVTVFNPVVILNHSSTLCAGTTRILDAGNFSSYLWSDGSAGRTLLVKDTGTFFVRVSDSNGCKASDTSIIATLLIQPKNFLPKDSSICNSSSILIIGGAGYQSYLWSDNSTGHNLTVTQPGLYWLQVTGNNNCVGRDSIQIIPKECYKGFYMPSAFTPNGDTHNDKLRPLIFGNVLQFDLVIYNRYGQLVFHSDSQNNGWNGSFLGMKQENGAYVWICRYQLSGEEVNTKRGSVILIR